MKTRLWLRLVSACLLPALSFVPISTANSATVGTGNCVQTVGSATGITVTTYSNRCVVKFTNTASTTWSVPRGVTKVWVLVVGGGGGGGSDEGGGGGAGGFIENQNFAVTSQSEISLNVGYGGTGAINTLSGRGANGSNSTFSSLTAIGGGGGGSAINSTGIAKNGSSGGSGGGGSGAESYGAGTYGAGTAGQGFRGDTGTSTRGGGGGGATEIGDTNGTARGGDGKATTILNGSTGTTFAGGGGGGGGNSVSGAIAGGAGGGGAGGGNATCPVNGTVNTGGGGGGGGGATCSDYDGADGGSGIVVINYQFDITAPTVTSTATQSISENTSTSTNILTIKASESATMVMAVGDDSGDFSLFYSDSTTSLLRFVSVPDFEAPQDVGQDNIYNFTLNLEDYSGNTSTQAFTITVTNVNEAPVIGSFSGNTAASYSVAENSVSLYNLNASDEDAGTSLSYSLTGTDATDFSISATGDLSFISGPDFEDARDSNGDNVYLVITWVSDGALSDSQTMTITVTDINENGSVSAPTLSAEAKKGISVTISVSLNTPGKVLFTANGKRIPNCVAVRTSGSYPSILATCNWKPNVTGRIFIQARLTPTLNTYSAASSQRLPIWVVKRTTTR